MPPPPTTTSEAPSPDSVACALSNDHGSIDTSQDNNDNDDDLDSPSWNYIALYEHHDHDDLFIEEQVDQSREHQHNLEPSPLPSLLHQRINHDNTSTPTITAVAATYHPLPPVEPILPHPTIEERIAGMVMTEERKIAVLKAMKGVSLDYRPPWAGKGGGGEGKKDNILEDG